MLSYEPLYNPLSAVWFVSKDCVAMKKDHYKKEGTCNEKRSLLSKILQRLKVAALKWNASEPFMYISNRKTLASGGTLFG